MNKIIKKHWFLSSEAYAGTSFRHRLQVIQIKRKASKIKWKDMNKISLFFNHSFDKKKLKAFIYWVLKTFGEKDALTIVEELKRMGFYNATKAGLSIGLNDLKTPENKKFLISNAQITMNKTDQEFQGAEVTATERSQRIIDTWHRTSEDLRKQVVDYFSTYDQLNSVYMMALSGARGNFSQVRQLIGMRGLMADPQGQIISFPIRSNLREGLTLTEYFISCSGARKGLVDTALRTADTGYLTRRLVDISHHIVVKKVTCYTSRGIALKTLRTSHKILLPLKDRLVGRVLGENVYTQDIHPEQSYPKGDSLRDNKVFTNNRSKSNPERYASSITDTISSIETTKQTKQNGQNIIARKNQEISPDLASKISLVKEKASINTVLVRSPLTCTYTHEVCQLCYGWSMAQGNLVSLGEAVGVIAGQSIGEPGTQLTMRTFHTGGVFSGDLLQEIRAPHSGKIWFPKALQGLLIRTSQGKIAFLIKVSGELLIESENVDDKNELARFVEKRKATRLSLEPSTILFVRQGEKVKNHQILAELAITTEEGNQPIQSRQTLFSEMRGRIVQWKSVLSRLHRTKGSTKKRSFDINSDKALPMSFKERSSAVSLKNELRSGTGFKRKDTVSANGLEARSLPETKHRQSQQLGGSLGFARNGVTSTVTDSVFSRSEQAKLREKKSSVLNQELRSGQIQAYLGPAELTQSSIGATLGTQQKHERSSDILNTNKQLFTERDVQQYEETWENSNILKIKRIVSAKKHGLGSIEPPKALKLGLLSVIATRIGASQKMCTKAITYDHLGDKTQFCQKTSQNLNTIAEEGDLVDEKYVSV